MILKSYLFCRKQNNYIQYPNDYTASFLKPLCSCKLDKHQVVVYRDGGLMYYSYLFNNGNDETFGLCVATGLLCTQLKSLYDRFISCLDVFSRRGVIFHYGNNGDVQMNEDFLLNIGEVEELFRWLKNHNESKTTQWSNLPPEDHTISKGTTVQFNFEEDDHTVIVDATRHYTYVFITMHNPTPTSYSGTVKRLSSQNEMLKSEKEQLTKQIEHINKKKKQYELVIGLIVFLLIGSIVAFSIISDKNTKIKAQITTIQEKEKTIEQQDNKIEQQVDKISSQTNTINEQSQTISHLENRVLELEKEREGLQPKIKAVNSMLQHIPFIVTQTEFSFDKGRLTVYYYAANSGTKRVKCKVIKEIDKSEIYERSITVSLSCSSGANSFVINGLNGLNGSKWYLFDIYSDDKYCGGGRH